ncbi:hypothetical protein SAMN05216524_109172 [Mucilaginibacter sp. OK098]|nr:hypothetical protein SAMN05216524_109172 [Mucilaginibacter sp. OK098]
MSLRAQRGNRVLYRANIKVYNLHSGCARRAIAALAMTKPFVAILLEAVFIVTADAQGNRQLVA